MTVISQSNETAKSLEIREAPVPEVRPGRILLRDGEVGMAYVVLGVHGDRVDTVMLDGDLQSFPLEDAQEDLEHLQSAVLDALAQPIAAGLHRCEPLRRYGITHVNGADADAFRVKWWKGSDRPDLVRPGVTVRVNSQDDEAMCVVAAGNDCVLLSASGVHGGLAESLENIEVAEVLGAPFIAHHPTSSQVEGSPLDLRRFHQLCVLVESMVKDYFPSPSEDDPEIVATLEGQVVRVKSDIMGSDNKEIREAVENLIDRVKGLLGSGYTELRAGRGKRINAATEGQVQQ